MLDQKEKIFLLNLARLTIENYLEKKKTVVSDVPEALKEKAGVFVSLHKNDDLRGCIGCLEAKKEIYLAVMENAIQAAFYDPRFKPLSKEELNEVEIEISILSQPKELIFNNSDDLLEKLPEDWGVIIQKNHHQATFLPKVWKMLPEKEKFLTHLSLKAGLSPFAWKEEKIKIFIYQAEVFSE